MKAKLPVLSLRAKLVLSYLAVTLGAILLLSVVVSFAIQNYFANVQREELQSRTVSLAQQIGSSYASYGSWDNMAAQHVGIPLDMQLLAIIIDTSGTVRASNPLHFLVLNQNNQNTISQVLAQALHGQTSRGQFQSSTDDGDTVTSMYYAAPIYYNGQSNAKIVGAIIAVEPQQYPQGFSPGDFITNVNQAILISGLVAAAAVIIFSLMLVRGLTRPLASLTKAAEQMREGDYSRRVEPPKSMDELGRLSQTFNEMADTIESDVNELRRQEQFRRELLANIAHDLATPLTAIQGFSEAMADDVISDPQARQETAQLIAREVQRMRRLVADMQQMTSLESGRAHLDIAPLDMRELVDETLAVIMPECEQAGITLRNEIAPGTPHALADSDRVTQVLLNLLDNARRHTPAGGTLTVGARPTGKLLAIWVSDTGTGIDPADLPNIFERFYRADRSRTGATGGSGLGLSIVKAIITAHGGTITAESQVGKGTRVTFTLPLSGSGLLAPPKAPAQRV